MALPLLASFISLIYIPLSNGHGQEWKSHNIGSHMNWDICSSSPHQKCHDMNANARWGRRGDFWSRCTCVHFLACTFSMLASPRACPPIMAILWSERCGWRSSADTGQMLACLQLREQSDPSAWSLCAGDTPVFCGCCCTANISSHVDFATVKATFVLSMTRLVTLIWQTVSLKTVFHPNLQSRHLMRVVACVQNIIFHGCGVCWLLYVHHANLTRI